MQDLIFNLETIETEYGKSFKIALPIKDTGSYQGKRIEISPIDDWCPIDKEEFEKIIDRLIEIPN